MTPGTGRRTVFVVDDDPAVRKSLERLLREDGWPVETYVSAEDFLARRKPGTHGCLVLDLTLPGLDGIGLQSRLVEGGERLPIVFLTGYGDIPTSVRAMRAGATEFLTKPVRAEALLGAIRLAFAEAGPLPSAATDLAVIRQRLAGLTPRELEVLEALTAGKTNKEIARDLGIVEQTVKFHRARIMTRMGASSVAELMHMAARLAINPRH